jgi:hypothetical protein
MRRALPVLLCVLLGAAGAGAAPAPRASSRALQAGLRAAGRGEAVVQLSRTEPLGGRTSVTRGRLVLELPGRARLELADGQRLTLREDGGDWLQPAARQLVRAGTRSAAGALAWWGALLDPQAAGIREQRSGSRRYTLVRPGDEGGQSQQVELGADGLPRLLVLEAGSGGRVEYRLSRWRFVPPRGRADFVLAAPPGFEVVEMP